MMTTCPEKIIRFMDDYLDGDLNPEDEAVMKGYLESCSDCRKTYHELNKTIALVQSASHIKAPADFVEKAMQRLPKEKKRGSAKRWFRRHPFVAAAALFMLMMSAALFTSFSEDQQFAFTKQPNLQVQGETVIVPEGMVVNGDLTIRNGDLRVEGELNGDVTIVNGQFMASSGVITGEIEEIDQIFEWLWYQIKEVSKDAAAIFTADPANK